MLSGFIIILVFIIVFAPAVFGIFQVQQWRQESGGSLDSKQKLMVGGFFGPMALFIVLVAMYLLFSILAVAV